MPETTPAPTAQPARSGVFRKQAIERQSAPSDQLDQLLRVTPARGWVALLALCAVVLAAIGYGLLGTIPTTVSGQGVFLPPGGLTRIDASVAGTVSAVDVREGDPITRGAAVATIVDAQAKEQTVRSTLSGTVTEVFIDDGNFVFPGTELVVVEPTADAVTAVLYVPAGQGKAVGRGMDVHLSPSTAPSEQYGQVLGTVASISEFPVSSERLEFVLQNDILVDQISALGSVLEVTVAVTADPATASGVAWTSGDGPPFVVHNGTLTTAAIILESETPAQKLFDPRD